ISSERAAVIGDTLTAWRVPEGEIKKARAATCSMGCRKRQGPLPPESGPRRSQVPGENEPSSSAPAKSPAVAARKPIARLWRVCEAGVKTTRPAPARAGQKTGDYG